jgi:arginase
MAAVPGRPAVTSSSPVYLTGMRRYALLEAPSNLGLKPGGVEGLPKALIATGLQERLHAWHAGCVIPPPYKYGRDVDTGFLNTAGIATYAVELANAVGSILKGGDIPVILGGDCSILLGSLLALRRRGRYGLWFIDGHTDFYQPEANINGEVASSELALATGRGPDALADLEGLRPLVRDEDVVVFGFRDQEEQIQYGSQRLSPQMKAMSLIQISGYGVKNAARHAVETLERPELDGFWVHLDADVLDDAIMPAVDYRLPGGLLEEELMTALQCTRCSPRFAGIEVTIYNPRLDPHGTAGKRLADILVHGLTA